MQCINLIKCEIFVMIQSITRDINRSGERKALIEWKELDPELLLRMLADGQIEPEQIIDVREAYEWDYYHLESSRLIPMNTIPYSLGTISDDKPLYIVCAHGVRSAAVCNYLEEQGYGNLHNVTGGMAAIASLQGFQYD
ncbi:hypothetical protein PghCCS26_33860 [Paenibacillus glycanilyticus]|uniref:Rhodanese domain-containing protein n=1 Tax=Paenibacillus glycanilyticus TaxID=126569 RepID=A0ABQ6NMB6_9BACL|nr:hypothetical protein PghCCS26_33860 [Paenibacillus glycanilyticus]